MYSTLLAFERYLNAKDKSLFDNIVLPEELDKDTLVDTIFMTAEDKPVALSNPYLLRTRIRVFFQSNYKNFSRLAKAVELDYEPLENYNRTEKRTLRQDHNTDEDGNTDVTVEISREGSTTSTDTTKIEKSGNSDSTDTTAVTNSGTDTTTNSSETTKSGSISEAQKVYNGTSAFNQGTDTVKSDTAYSADNMSDNAKTTTYNSTKDTTTGSGSTTYGSKSQNSGGVSTETSDTEQHSGGVATANESTDNETTNTEYKKGIEFKGTDTEESNVFGNVGVTTSQQMLKAEVDLWRYLNIYQYIADDLVDNICLPIWY